MKEVSYCIKGMLDGKTIDDSLLLDEEIYEFLKKIYKHKDYESKYRN